MKNVLHSSEGHKKSAHGQGKAFFHFYLILHLFRDLIILYGKIF